MKSISDDRQVPQQRYSPDNPNDKSTSRKFRHALALTIISLSLKMYAHIPFLIDSSFIRGKRKQTWGGKTGKQIVASFIEIEPAPQIRHRFKSRSFSRSGLYLGVVDHAHVNHSHLLAPGKSVRIVLRVERSYTVHFKSSIKRNVYYIIRKNFIKVYYTL